MALDVGDVRIGVALSRSGIIAEPHSTLQRIGRRQILDAIGTIIAAERVTHCILGLPLLERGVEGSQAEKTRAFSRSMARRFPELALEFEDERYTSAEAAELAGTRAQSDRGLIDRIAAAVILQQYLDRTTAERAAPPSQSPL
jgi:putative Holliday junction resolvase